jgi:hypothetical protein
MDRKAIKFRLSPREIEENRRMPAVDPLSIPWQDVDIISSMCPKHAGVRMERLDDVTYRCPHGGEIYRQHGSMTNQTNRDNYYTGQIIK